jgi:hypothetical protein
MHLYASYAKQKCTKYRQRIKKLPFQRLPLEQVERSTGGDEANKTFKDRNKLIYGENRVYNPTDFKSQTKKIDTIFSPEVIRKWDNRVGIPLGINYAASSSPEASDTPAVVLMSTVLSPTMFEGMYTGSSGPCVTVVVVATPVPATVTDTFAIADSTARSIIDASNAASGCAG